MAIGGTSGTSASAGGGGGGYDISDDSRSLRRVAMKLALQDAINSGGTIDDAIANAERCVSWVNGLVSFTVGGGGNSH